jgi:nucleoside-diphosphate-sugar epimerase
MKLAVLGATGKTGRHLVARLCADGHAVIAVGRDAARLAALDGRAERRIANLEAPRTVTAALRGAERVVSLAHARFTTAVLAGLPEGCERVVLTGSTRRFSRLPDPAADAVRAGERAFEASGRRGVMLHPSMIYGAPEDRNVNRLLRLIRRWPRWLPFVPPLPGGGRHLVQPVHVDDMLAALASALLRPEAPGPPIVVAGPAPITYAAMVRACAAALGRRAFILPLPLPVLTAAAGLLLRLRVRLPFDAAELRRATEDKCFDVSDMERRLGVRPRDFEAGLAARIALGGL